MNKKITLALIGKGHWGQVYKKTIAGISNILLPDRNIFGKDYKTGLKKIRTNDIDGIIVASSTYSHYEVVTYLLKHGFYKLLIEKPLTQTFAQAKKLQKLLQTYPKARVLVGHTLIYDPAYKIMKKIAPKKLGKILKINYSSLKTPPIKATVLQDAGSPPVYLFIDIAGRMPKKVWAKTTKHDNITLSVQFDDDLLGIANIGTIYPIRKRELSITGERGKLLLNEFVNPRQLSLIDYKKGEINLQFPENRTSLEEELLEFTKFITKGGKPKTPVSAGVDVVKVVQLAEESLRKNGKPILVR